MQVKVHDSPVHISVGLLFEIPGFEGTALFMGTASVAVTVPPVLSPIETEIVPPVWPSGVRVTLLVFNGDPDQPVGLFQLKLDAHGIEVTVNVTGVVTPHLLIKFDGEIATAGVRVIVIALTFEAEVPPQVFETEPTTFSVVPPVVVASGSNEMEFTVVDNWNGPSKPFPLQPLGIVQIYRSTSFRGGWPIAPVP